MLPLPYADDDHPLASFLKIPPNFHLPHNDILINDHTPTSIHDLFIPFPSPFYDDPELPLNQILPKNLIMNPSASDQLLHHQPRANFDGVAPKKESTKCGGSKLKSKSDDQTGSVAARRRSLGVVPRRRPGKKDRHSKISTAQGIRDRRMRLSLQIARKFFDLQDMLGYDKASKTIEWLFSKSKKAIKEVIKDSDPLGKNSISMSSDEKTESFVSESEVVSGIDQENSNIEVKDGNNFVDNEIPVSSKSCVKAEIKSRKALSKPNIMRESRENARARARSRTKEKFMNKGGVENACHFYRSSPNCNDPQKLGSSNNPFEAHQAESGSINQQEPMVSPYGANEYTSTPFGQQMADVGTIEKLLGTSGSSAAPCPSMISDYYCSVGVSCCIDPNNSFNMGFLGNWDLLNSDSRINNSVTNEVSLAGNPSSDYSVSTPNFPFYQQWGLKGGD